MMVDLRLSQFTVRGVFLVQAPELIDLLTQLGEFYLQQVRLLLVVGDGWFEETAIVAGV